MKLVKGNRSVLGLFFTLLIVFTMFICTMLQVGCAQNLGPFVKNQIVTYCETTSPAVQMLTRVDWDEQLKPIKVRVYCDGVITPEVQQ